MSGRSDEVLVGNRAASVPPATLSTTGRRRSQPRLTRKLKITTALSRASGAALSTWRTAVPPVLSAATACRPPDTRQLVNENHMRLQAAAGRTDAVRRTFQLLETRLAELAAAPGSATR